MNKRAYVVHDLMAGASKRGAGILPALSPQARAALEDLQGLLKRSPPASATLLAQDRTATLWFGLTPAGEHPTWT